MDKALRDIVIPLYGWSRDEELRKLVPTLHRAIEVVRELSKSPRWRERVVAAKLIRAYQLAGEVDDLVRTFAACPESHTVQAFSEMLAEVRVPNAEELLNEMREACRKWEHGQDLVKIINWCASVEVDKSID